MRVAIISDVHANLPALDAVLAALGQVDAIWQLGDVVGYGPHPDEVVARLRDLGVIGVRGNHDAAALGELDVEAFNPDARRAIEWTRERIAPATRSWLAALPERRAEGELSMVHGSPRDPIWEYVLDRWTAGQAFAAFSTRWCLHGHTHLPIAWIENGQRPELFVPEPGATMRPGDRRVLVNPGSVGQPRDGDPRASALVYDSETGTLTWQRIPYPIDQVQAAMRAARLPAFLVDRLDRGR